MTNKDMPALRGYSKTTTKTRMKIERPSGTIMEVEFPKGVLAAKMIRDLMFYVMTEDDVSIVADFAKDALAELERRQ